MNQQVIMEDDDSVRSATSRITSSTDSSQFDLILSDMINNGRHQFPGVSSRQRIRRVNRVLRPLSILSLLPILLCALLLIFHRAYAMSHQSRYLQKVATAGSSVDIEACYTDLNTSDVNSDGIISQSEFFLFVQSSANGTLDATITEYYLLPPNLISVYNYFACGNANYACPSIPGIDISGISDMTNEEIIALQNEGGVSSQQEILLMEFCTSTEQIIIMTTGSAMEPTASNNSTTPSPTLSQTNLLVPTMSPTAAPLPPTAETIAPIAPSNSNTTSPTPNGTSRVPTIPPTRSPVPQSLLPTTMKPITATPPPTLKATTRAPTTMKPITATPPPTMKATTRAPTLSPTTLLPTTIPRCPPMYEAGELYEAGDVVANHGDGDDYSYYQCKSYPWSAWCSQSAYEPGNSLNWDEAWKILGQCSVDEPTITSAPSFAVIATTPTLSPSTYSTPNPSSKPTIDGYVPPYSGPIVTTFQYEMYNSQNANAQSIITGEDPANNILSILVQSTDVFVEDVVATTFGTNENGASHSKASGRRLSVYLENDSVTIDNVVDITCSDPTFPSPCQNVTASVELTVVEEPLQSTTVECQTAIENALLDPGISFPTGSNLVYISTSSAPNVSAIVLPESTAPTISPENQQTGTPGWVVPVSICIAVIGSTLLLLLVGKEMQKRKREGSQNGGDAPKESDDEEIYRDIMGSSNREGSSDSYPEIHVSPNKDISPLDGDNYDLESGKRAGVMQSKSNPFLEGSDSGSSSENSVPSDMSSESFRSGSSSSSSSSYIPASYPDSNEFWAKKEKDEVNLIQCQSQQVQPMLHFMSLNTLNEEGTLSSSEQSLLSASNSDGKLADSSAYRAGVEALVREACPDKIDKVDDMLVEYEGREELLIDHLTKMLGEKRQSEGDSAERSTATFDDVYDNTYRSTTATFDYDYSTATGNATGDETGAKADKEMPPVITESGDSDEIQSSSSSVGSSEWTSDDGFSSIDATSMTASTDGRSVSPDTAAALAALGVVTAFDSQGTSQYVVSNPMFIPSDTTPDSPNDEDLATGTHDATEDVTQDDLDKAIEAGDWRSVSATAALIANTYTTESTSLDESDHSQLSISAQNQVKEFERLVEDGNWDAVIAAATRIDSATSDIDLNDSWTGSVEESPPSFERFQKDREQHADLTDKSQEELIDEIKVLVAEVVPDELENIDEMLEQFKGREEDLVTTLRTMQKYQDESANASVFEEDSDVATDGE